MSTATDASPTAPGQGLLTFYLADADTNEIIRYLNPGETIDTSDYAGRNVTIAAEPTDGNAGIGSVELKLGGTTRVENVSPYALFGDTNGNFSGTSGFTSGAQELEIKVYGDANASGALLDSFSVPFTFGEGDPDNPADPEPDLVSVDPNALINQFDHVFFHFDGNNNDPDDIAAIPVAAVLAKAAGIEDKTTLLYGNNLAEANASDRKAKLDDGGDFAKELGLDAYNYQDDIDATTALLVDKLNSGEKILMIEGGPMEAAYRALEQTDPANHANITLLSHSSWNENRDVINNPSDPGLTEARTWDDIRDDFPGVTQIDIRDQNDGNNNDKGFNNQAWSWLDATDDPVLQDARAIMEPAGSTKKNDPSDAGMLFYALTGIENGTPQDARTFIESSPAFGGPGTPANSAPVANPDTAETTTDKAVVIDVLANDSDPDGDPLTIEITGQPAGGTAEVENGKIVYTPDTGSAGSQTVRYTVSDGNGAVSQETTVTVTVSDDAPDPEPDPDTTSEYLSFFFADTDTNEIITTLEDGDVLDAGLFEGRNVTIAATHIDDDSPVESVRLTMGSQSRLENVEPYALFGDTKGDFFDGTSLGEGTQDIEISVYDKDKGGGDLLESLTLQFTVDGGGLGLA
ncbi:Ig-like domain-containing protein [Roseibium sp. HPY-6]|uniref:Ig-like domain-containing protein n=1 Tax=Roseibium sp. HPY-6 TaxID=3229852 RepID=UPI00338F8BE2